METVQKDLIAIEGEVDSVLFRNSENGYIVLDLDTGSDLVTVVGELGNIDVGEELRLTGEYVNHPKFGSQFKAQICERKMPATSSAILKYLSSGAIKGIGPAMAKKIVDKFGEKSLDIIENEPEKLLEIKGITKKRIEEASQEFKRINGIRSLMIFLSKFNILPSIAVKIWKRWGQFSIDVIKENPYVLCRNGIELEFEKAEYIADKLERPKDDINRIRAGIFYVLFHNTFNGHCCLPADRLKAAAISLLKTDEEKYAEALSAEEDDDNIVIFDKNGREFVYLYDYFRAESYITDRLSLMRGCFINSDDDYSKLIDIEETAKGITYAEQQRKAISLALSQGFLILTGGPGTGKTTTLKAIISLYEQRGMKVMIAAPTGRAAKRISDLTGYPAKTIHRLLEVVYDSTGQLKFKHDENDPVSCDVMIIDEMSMVDCLLFEALLRAMKLSCRLIMVGDSDQLPSVGAGNLLKDMTDCGRLTVVQLTEIFRQAQQSAIITNAHRIVSGEDPVLTLKDNDFFFMQRLDSEKAAALVAELYSERLPKAYNYSPFDDIQVLCPSRKGALGVTELNRLLQQRINPPEKGRAEVKGILYTFRDGDKVMQTKNNYDILWKKENEEGAGIFNGDIGTIIKVRRSDSKVIIDFEGRITEYAFDMLDQLELAYAITVHKSQGSEFNAVIIPLLGGFDKLYYRNLLYTAVTRAKKLLIIVGSSAAVERMVANNRRTLRYSCLKYMLETNLEERQTEL
ncbi:MAG: ATP-dependent RecD-like DNA helicase [Oscillospiraceae bacterium]|nr:ATP-dependent RecD-like DNA helicase [Oscillospiraceae bacterium]